MDGDAVDDALALFAASIGADATRDAAANTFAAASNGAESAEEGELSDSSPSPKKPRPEAAAPRSEPSGRHQVRGTAQPGPRAPKVPCRYFMEGRCTKGDRCTFSHAVRPNKTPEEARSTEPCRFMIAGRCLKGDDCLYSHDLSRVPCRHFHVRGDCAASRTAAGCRFSHAPLSDDERRALFAEVMGTRDPRLSPAVDDRTGSSSFVYVPPVRRALPPDPIVARYALCMDPLVARLDPFGSPFAPL